MAHPSPLIWASFFGTFWVNFSDFFSKLKTKLLKYFPEICLIILEPLPESTESTALKGGYSGLKWILWRISLTFETLWSPPKSRFLPKIVLIVNFRSKCLECAPFLSNAHFYQTFRKNFHQNFGVCGLIGNHWRTLTPLFLSKFRIPIKLFAKIFTKISECVAL